MSFGERRLSIPLNLEVEAIFRSIFLVAVMEEDDEPSGPDDEPRPSVVVVVASASFGSEALSTGDFEQISLVLN